jgi:hypothetical protein
MRSRIIEALAPGERRHVAIFKHRFVGNETKALAQGDAHVGIRAMIEEKASECCVPLSPTEVDV